MFSVQLEAKDIVSELGTSDGTQTKYYKDGYWYKTDMLGNEGEVEFLCSGILQFSNLKKDEYVEYDKGVINLRNGCRSKCFLKDNETFITFNSLHKNVTSLPMYEKVNFINALDEKIEYVIYFIKSICGVNITEYLKKIFTLDYIILNEDRHFNNLGMILDENGKYRTAPIFDNGKSLLNGNFSVKSNLPISENVNRVIARPFGGTHKKVYEYFGKGFDIDTAKAIKWLEKQPYSYSRDVLIYQLEIFG